MAGNLDFEASDIVCVILPEADEEELTQEFLKRGIPVVSPSWSVDRIVAEFSGQARQGKELWAMAKSARDPARSAVPVRGRRRWPTAASPWRHRRKAGRSASDPDSAPFARAAVGLGRRGSSGTRVGALGAGKRSAPGASDRDPNGPRPRRGLGSPQATRARDAAGGGAQNQHASRAGFRHVPPRQPRVASNHRAPVDAGVANPLNGYCPIYWFYLQ